LSARWWPWIPTIPANCARPLSAAARRFAAYSFRHPCSFYSPGIVTGEALRPVALLAGFARRTKILYRRWYRPRIGVEGHRNHLAQTGKLRLYKPPGSRSNVTLDASHPRVGRILIGGVLRVHHGVTGLAAEIHRIHILHAAVGSGPDNQEFSTVATPTYSRVRRTTGKPRSTVGKTAGISRSPADRAAGPRCRLESAVNRVQKFPEESEKPAGRHKDGVARAGRCHRTRRRSCKRCARRNHGAGERNGVLPQVVDRLRPVLKTFSQSHLKRYSPSFPTRAWRERTYPSGAASSRIPDNLPALLTDQRGLAATSASGCKPPSPYLFRLQLVPYLGILGALPS